NEIRQVLRWVSRGVGRNRPTSCGRLRSAGQITPHFTFSGGAVRTRGSGCYGPREGASLSVLMRPLGIDPIVHQLLHHQQWQRSVAEQQVVNGADVEAVAKSLPRAFAQLEQLEMPDLVRAGLTRLNEVSVYLRAH